MDEIWPLLSQSTRDWLIANAGDAVPFELAAEIDDVVEATGADDVWERTPVIPGIDPEPVDDEDEDEDDEEPDVRYLGDTAVDWIEARANDE